MAVWLGCPIARPVATPGHPAIPGSLALKPAPWLLGFAMAGLSGLGERQYSTRTPRLKTQHRAAKSESFGLPADLQVLQGKFEELDMKVSQRDSKAVLEEDQELAQEIASILKYLARLLGLSLAVMAGRRRNHMI
eukprot:Skav202413  [mRNA]  locus=scaffold1370:81999:82564:+ [translate_table: standard]